MIRDGANVLATSSKGRNALHFAASRGDEPLTKLLLRKRWDVHFVNATSSDGLTPLMYSAYGGHGSIAKHLVAHGARTDVETPDGLTAERIAEDRNHTELSYWLLRVQVLLNNGWTPFMIVAFYGDSEAVELLIEHNMQHINDSDADNFTALHVAATKGKSDIARLILKKGANANVITQRAHITPLMAATQNGHLDVAEIILSNGANIDMRARNGATALYMATCKNHTDMVGLLLNNSSNVNIANENGWTPLMAAAKNGYVPVAEMFIEHGAKIAIKGNDGTTALYTAFRNCHWDMVLLLENSGKGGILCDGNNVIALPIPRFTELCLFTFDWKLIDVMEIIRNTLPPSSKACHQYRPVITLSISQRRARTLDT